MKKTVFYPKIEGAEPIKSWGSREQYVVDLEPEASISLPIEVADQLMATFSFLEEAEEVTPRSKPTKAQKEEEIKQSEELGLPTDWLSLRKMAKEDGIYVSGMTREDIIAHYQALKEEE